MKLKLPVLMYINRKLDVDNGIGMRAMGMAFPTSHVMYCKETVRKHRPGWLLEFNGNFRTLTPMGKRREWARPLSKLWRFTQSVYGVSDPRTLTVAELQHLLEPVKDHFAEARTAGGLRRALRDQDPSARVDQALLSRLNL